MRRRTMLRVVVAIVLALGVAILSACAIPHLLGTGQMAERPTILMISAVNCVLVLFYVLMGQTIIEDGFISLVILLIAIAVGYGMRHGHGAFIWAIPLGIFAGLLSAMIANLYVREIT